MVASVVIAATGGNVFAAGGATQWQIEANGSFMNAWNGGPLIKIYNGQALNNDFLLIHDPHGSGYYELELLTGGHSTYDGFCIGDYTGSSTNARAGMVGCGSSSVAPGYGALFSLAGSSQGCRSGDYAFKNVHWNGWLGATGDLNGDQFYLNNAASVCFHPIAGF